MIDRYHVLPRPYGGWNVRKQGNSRISRVFRYQKDALQWAQARARDVVLHDMHGRIVDRWTLRP